MKYNSRNLVLHNLACKDTTKIWNTQIYLCFGGKKTDVLSVLSNGKCNFVAKLVKMF